MSEEPSPLRPQDWGDAKEFEVTTGSKSLSCAHRKELQKCPVSSNSEPGARLVFSLPLLHLCFHRHLLQLLCRPRECTNPHAFPKHPCKWNCVCANTAEWGSAVTPPANPSLHECLGLKGLHGCPVEKPRHMTEEVPVAQLGQCIASSQCSEQQPRRVCRSLGSSSLIHEGKARKGH